MKKVVLFLIAVLCSRGTGLPIIDSFTGSSFESFLKSAQSYKEWDHHHFVQEQLEKADTELLERPTLQPKTREKSKKEIALEELRWNCRYDLRRSPSYVKFEACYAKFFQRFPDPVRHPSVNLSFDKKGRLLDISRASFSDADSGLIECLGSEIKKRICAKSVRKISKLNHTPFNLTYFPPAPARALSR